MRVGNTSAVVACTLALACGLAGANSQDLKPLPDIFSDYTTVIYQAGNGSTGTFTADGYAETIELASQQVLNIDPTDPYADPPSISFHLQANIDKNLILAPGAQTSVDGQVSITGTVSDLGAVSGTLLVGTLFRFGYSYAGDGLTTFEFTFDVTGGDLAAKFGPTATVNLVSVTNFTPNFAQSFTNDNGYGFGIAQSDTYPYVPEPASLLGVLLGAGSLAGYLRRRRA